MTRGRRGRRGTRARNTSRSLGKQQRGQVKDIVHKQADRSRLLRPKYIQMLPEIKIVPRQSFTLRIASSLWKTTTDENVQTRTLRTWELWQGFRDYHPFHVQIESICLYGPRYGGHDPGTNGMHQPVITFAFAGSFTSGTADSDTSLYDNVQNGQMGVPNVGRQKLFFAYNQRDKNFAFQKPASSGTLQHNLVAVIFTTSGVSELEPYSRTDIYADVRLTRWGFLEAATLTGDPDHDMNTRMMWKATYPEKHYKYLCATVPTWREQEASVRNDVKLSASKSHEHSEV